MRKVIWFPLPFLTAFFLYASYYPWNISYMAWVALVPLIVFAIREEKRWRVFWLSYAAGYFYFVLAFQWTTYSIPIAPYLLAVYLGMYFALFALLIRSLSRHAGRPLWIVMPLAWTACDYLRSTLFGGLPWFLLGHTQHPFPHLIQIADITGVYGVCFLVAMGNALIARPFLGKGGMTRSRHPALIFIGLLLIAFVYGIVRARTMTIESGPRIAIIQANIPESIHRHFELSWDEMERLRDEQFLKFVDLTQEVLVTDHGKPDLVVWPEAAYPYPVWARLEDRQFFSEWQYQRLLDTSRKIGTPWVTGCGVIETRPEWLDEEEWKRHYRQVRKQNTALYFGKEGELLGRYDKVRLVPFVEYTPVARGLMEWATNLFSNIPDAPDMTSGTELKTMVVEGHRFGTIICYEGIFPWMARDMANQGAHFVINISNDGWFRDSAELDQMLVMARFRAVESRVGFVRATNTGISAFISPTGEVEEWVQDSSGKRKEVSGTLTRNVSWTRGSSLYRRWGEVFAQLACLILLGLLGLPRLRRAFA